VGICQAFSKEGGREGLPACVAGRDADHHDGSGGEEVVQVY